MPEGKDDIEELAPIPSQIGEVHNDPNYAHDAVFGEITEDGPNYRNVRHLLSGQLLYNTN